MSSQAVPAHAEIPPPRIEEVSPGIYAYIQMDGSWFLNNAGAVVGSRSATVIDTTGTEKRARAFHAAVRQVTPHPVSALINTHSHGDHTHGNFMFAPASAIIASERCRREIIAGGHASYALFPMIDFGDCPITPPTVTFDDRLSVYVDDLKVELIFVGPAHTTSDIVAWIPERKLLFSGDVIFNGGTPFALGGSVAGWLTALDRIEALGAETIVPGHGEICGPAVIGEVASTCAGCSNRPAPASKGHAPARPGRRPRPREVRGVARPRAPRPERPPRQLGTAGRTARHPLDYRQLFAEMLIQRQPAPAAWRRGP